MRHLLPFSMLTSALFSLATPARACVCEAVSYAQELEWADFVFVGTVVEVREDWQLVGDPGDESLVLVGTDFGLEVQETFKGALGASAIIRNEPSSCGGPELDRDTTYLLWADLPERGEPVPVLRTNKCSPIERFDPTSEAYRWLVANG